MEVSPTITDAPVQGPEPFELLRRLELLRSLEDSTLTALMEGVEPVQLQEGQVLVRQGAWDNALYAVATAARASAVSLKPVRRNASCWVGPSATGPSGSKSL
jgi:hypothetical protein